MEIVYVRGGDKLAPKVAALSGMAYGTRHDYKAYASIYMLDIHWRNYDWVDYLAILTAHMPTLAMVADYEFPSQREMMLQQIADLRAIGIEHVMCCPKFVGACADIPHDVILAISVPTGYAGFMPDPSEVGNRRVHLLGGHPDQQAYCIYHKYAAANVVSVDGNELAFKANKGQFWSKSGGWRAAPKKRFSSEILMIYSARNIVAYLKTFQPIFNKRVTKRVKACMYSAPLL
jgi:hypothetical protein